MGIDCGANVFVTKPLLSQFDRVVSELQQLNLEKMSWEIAGYCPTARHRAYEQWRPDIDDLEGKAERIGVLSHTGKKFWTNPRAYAARWMDLALSEYRCF